jgi:hypothetical protein
MQKHVTRHAVVMSAAADTGLNCTSITCAAAAIHCVSSAHTAHSPHPHQRHAQAPTQPPPPSLPITCAGASATPPAPECAGPAHHRRAPPSARPHLASPQPLAAARQATGRTGGPMAGRSEPGRCAACLATSTSSSRPERWAGRCQHRQHSHALCMACHCARGPGGGGERGDAQPHTRLESRA